MSCNLDLLDAFQDLDEPSENQLLVKVPENGFPTTFEVSGNFAPEDLKDIQEILDRLYGTHQLWQIVLDFALKKRRRIHEFGSLGSHTIIILFGR